VSAESSAIPRHALVSLLVRAEQAAASGDEAKAKVLLSDLHWFAHADGQLHRAVHRMELALARRRGDVAGSLGQVLPNLFAGLVSFVETFTPQHEVVRDLPAPPEHVYRVIADVGAYAQWNPWVVDGKGEAAKVGDEVVVQARLGRSKMKVGHRVLVATPGERFGWCDMGWFTPLASGRRLRWIEATPDGSRLVSRIKLYGPFAHLAWILHGSAIRRGMASEAEALGERAATLHRAARRDGARAASGEHAIAAASDDKPLAGKTCVVTGPTHGIGRPTALTLAELGARVVLVCRSKEKGDSVAREVAARGGEAIVVLADLASLRDVDVASRALALRFPQIDLLVNNAAVLNHERRVTVDGFEEGFGVNFLAHYLLTHRLLPSLRRAPSARIVNVSSNSHPIAGRFDPTDHDWSRRRFVSYTAYAHSKLAILLGSRALARRLAGTNVTSNALHPGVIATGMGTDHPRLGKILNPLVKPIFLTPEEGALTTIYAATSPDVAGLQGEYFSDCKRATPGKWAKDDATGERLYALAGALLADRGFAVTEAS
jgi:NAD(P)-dependent dehydrogenase (short-subunit alcohol dehydrogenase family)